MGFEPRGSLNQRFYDPVAQFCVLCFLFLEVGGPHIIVGKIPYSSIIEIAGKLLWLIFCTARQAGRIRRRDVIRVFGVGVVEPSEGLRLAARQAPIPFRPVPRARTKPQPYFNNQWKAGWLRSERRTKASWFLWEVGARHGG